MMLAQFSKLDFSDFDAYAVLGYRFFPRFTIGVKDRIFKVEFF